MITRREFNLLVLASHGVLEATPPKSAVDAAWKDMNAAVVRSRSELTSTEAAALSRDVALCAARVIRSYGVEYLRTEKNGYFYLNTGDTYGTTLLVPDMSRCRSNRRLPFVWSWGDVVEKEDK